MNVYVNGRKKKAFFVDGMTCLLYTSDYAAREVQLQEEIDNIESSHPGYDEYRYDLGMIGHDPVSYTHLDVYKRQL